MHYQVLQLVRCLHVIQGIFATDFWYIIIANQMFAGNCTTQVEFYDSPSDHNYIRAVAWSIVMAYLSHTHPAFETVFTIEAVNEPIQNAVQTPGFGRCEL